MKSKKYAVIVIVIILLVLVAVMMMGKRPFRSLKAEQIASMTVTLTPPDVTIELEPEQIQQAAMLISQIVTYQKDQSYTDYAGQGVIFTITMTDGTKHSIMGYNPFVVIDGVGYRTKQEPCEQLNRFANELL